MARLLHEAATTTRQIAVPAGEVGDAGLEPTGVINRRFRLSGQRVASAAIVVGTAAAAILTGRMASGEPPDASAPAALPAGAPSCSVRYTSHRGPEGTLSARLGVANTGQRQVPDAVLSFDMPAGSRITHTSATGWSQQDSTIHLTTPVLRPGASAQFDLRGTFDPARLEPPDGFALAGTTCMQATTTVNVTAAQASRPATGGRATGDRERLTTPATPSAGLAIVAPTPLSPSPSPSPSPDPAGTTSPSPTPTVEPEPTGSASPTTPPPSSPATPASPAPPAPGPSTASEAPAFGSPSAETPPGSA